MGLERGRKTSDLFSQPCIKLGPLLEGEPEGKGEGKKILSFELELLASQGMVSWSPYLFELKTI